MYKYCSNQEKRYGGFQNVSQNICIENFKLNSLQSSCLVLLTLFLLHNQKHCYSKSKNRNIHCIM